VPKAIASETVHASRMDAFRAGDGGLGSPKLTDRYVEVGGLTIHLRLGAPGRRDVVLLHGIPGSSRSWDRVLAHLPPDVRPVVPDLLGFGGSSRPTNAGDLHAEGQARCLALALASCGVEHPVLVGHDFGGPVALRLLMHNSDGYAGLVLAATNVFGDTPVPFPLSLVNAPLAGHVLARLLFSRPALGAMCRLGARRGRVETAPSLGDVAQSTAIRTIFSTSLADLPGLYGPIERFLPALRLPAHVVWGDADMFFPIHQGERTAAAISGAQFTVVERCGHFIPEEAPQQLAALIATCVSAVASPASSA
jgi:pimeloyl-ACP methyl ester carboxylesterase